MYRPFAMARGQRGITRRINMRGKGNQVAEKRWGKLKTSEHASGYPGKFTPFQCRAATHLRVASAEHGQ